MTQQPKFTYCSLEKKLEKQTKPIKDEKDKQIDAVKKQKRKKKLAALNNVDIYANENIIYCF